MQPAMKCCRLLIFLAISANNFQLPNTTMLVNIDLEDDQKCEGFNRSRSYDLSLNAAIIPTPFYYNMLSLQSSPGLYIYIAVDFGREIRAFVRQNYPTYDAFTRSFGFRYIQLPECLNSQSHLLSDSTDLCESAGHLWISGICQSVYRTMTEDANSPSSSGYYIGGGTQLDTDLNHIIVALAALLLCDSGSYGRAVFEFDNVTVACITARIRHSNVSVAMSDAQVVQENNRLTFASNNYTRNGTTLRCLRDSTPIADGGCDCSTKKLSGPFCFFPCPEDTVQKCNTRGLQVMNGECYYKECASYQLTEKYGDNYSFDRDGYVDLNEINSTLNSTHLIIHFIPVNGLCETDSYRSIFEDLDGYRPQIIEPDSDWLNWFNRQLFNTFNLFEYSLSLLHAYRNYRLTVKRGHQTNAQTFFSLVFRTPEAAAGAIATVTVNGSAGQPNTFLVSIKTDQLQCNGKIIAYLITLRDLLNSDKIFYNDSTPVDQDCLSVDTLAFEIHPHVACGYQLKVAAVTVIGNGSITSLDFRSDISYPTKLTTLQIIGIGLAVFFVFGTLTVVIVVHRMKRRKKNQKLKQFRDSFMDGRKTVNRSR